MALTEEHKIDAASPPGGRVPLDVLVDQSDDLFESMRAHAEGFMADLRAWGRLMLGAPGASPHGRTPAVRVQRGQQLVWEDGWWHVAAVSPAPAGGVALTLVRSGFAPLELTVDDDALFETAEPF